MATLFNAPTANFIQTTLNGSITNAVQTITLTSTANMQSPGYVVIDRTDSNGTSTPSAREVITYTGISGNNLTGCTRGADNSTARQHADGAVVETMPTIGMWNNLATIVASGFDSQGLLNSINSPVSITVINTNTLILPSTASIATANFQIVNQDGHIDIRPGTNKLIKIAVLEQDITSNVYNNNSVVLTGWGFITPGSVAQASQTFTFGITFASNPIVTGNLVSFQAQDPTTVVDLTNPPTNMAGDLSHMFFTIGASSKTQGFMTMRSTSSIVGGGVGQSYPTGRRYIYTWMAIGQL